MPLREAIFLSKEYESVDECILAYHERNINQIAQRSRCSADEAKRAYEIQGFDVEKTVKKLRTQIIKIAVKPSASKIGFIFFPMNKNREFYETDFNNERFINTDDFSMVREIFERNLPQICPVFGKAQQTMDDIGDNVFGKNEIMLCLNELEKMHEPRAFLKELAAYLKERVKYRVCKYLRQFIKFE